MAYSKFHPTFKIIQMSTVFRSKSNSVLVKYRKWEKVIEPLIKYDKHSSHFCYPIDFFLQIQKLLIKGISLKLNIPLTISGAHDHCLKTVLQDNQQIGTVVFTPNVLKTNFDIQIDKEINQKTQNLAQRDTQFRIFKQQKVTNMNFDQTMPFAIIKQKIVDQLENVTLKTFLLSKDQYKKLTNIEINQISQCFVYGNSCKTSLTRFFYYPMKETCSQAYKIDNHQSFVKKRFYKDLFRVKESKQHSFTFIKIMHNNKSFYQQTINLVKALESSLKVNIERIVCDWVIDPKNNYFLTQVREIKMQEIFSYPKINKNLNDVLSLITCCVCQQKFQSLQVSKLLTYKLIWQFFEHLKKRKIELNYRPNYHYSSNTVRICELCYMLVVSESKLIQVEKTIAKITNSLNQQEETSQIPQKLKKNMIKEYKESNLRQLYSWRLFFYIQDLKELQLDDFQNGITYYLMINLHNQITTFKLDTINSEHHHIKGIKISYLFSEFDKIDKFLNKSQIIFRITYQNNWNAVIAQGSSNSLYQQSEKFSMRKYKQILLFNQKSKYSVLGLHIGIKLQGKYNTQDLTLTKIYDAYVSNQTYINNVCLPPEWMEIMDPSYCLNQQRNKKFSYQLNLNKKEMQKLLPQLPKKKKLFL